MQYNFKTVNSKVRPPFPGPRRDVRSHFKDLELIIENLLHRTYRKEFNLDYWMKMLKTTKDGRKVLKIKNGKSQPPLPPLPPCKLAFSNVSHYSCFGFVLNFVNPHFSMSVISELHLYNLD